MKSLTRIYFVLVLHAVSRILVLLFHAFASQSLESDYVVTLDDSLKADVVVSCDTSR